MITSYFYNLSILNKLNSCIKRLIFVSNAELATKIVLFLFGYRMLTRLTNTNTYYTGVQ